MEIANLIEALPERYTPADQELLQRAFRFAAKAHKGQKRVSGEPYINHCLAVAIILAELHVPPVVVAAGLLHDTVEDTSVTLEDLRADFGDEIAKLVDGDGRTGAWSRKAEPECHAQSRSGHDRQARLPRTVSERRDR